jgi:tetratricopeptide (TPR) repeat protein
VLFDLSDPRRKNVIRVVYAFLAVIFAVGFIGFGIGGELGSGGLFDGLFGSGASGSTSEQFEDQIEEVEKRLEANPNDAEALAELASLRYQSGRVQLGVDEETNQVQLTDEARSEFNKAFDAWQEYLATDPAEPDAATAASMRDAYQLVGDWRNAAEAQAILAQDNPSFVEYANLAYYWYNALDLKAGDRAVERARKLAEGKRERDELKQFADLRKQAKKYKKQQGELQQDSDPLDQPAAPLVGSNPLGNALGSP